MKILVKRERGFTLVELVVVIAILGVLAGIAIPLITNFLSGGKQRAYDADLERIQQSVDAYYSDPSNTRFTGKRQYPTLAKDRGGTSAALLTSAAGNSAITTLGAANSNPVGGTEGGTPTWVDASTADGIRVTSSESLYYRSAAGVTSERWKTSGVTRSAVSYEVDSRDWLINMDTLVTGGWLKDVPSSASPDNKPTGSTNTYTGSYSWYVDSNGKVQSLNYYYPTTSSTGFQSRFP